MISTMNLETYLNLTNLAPEAAVMLFILRLVFGLYVFKEGFAKLTMKDWSSRGFFSEIEGPLGPLFKNLARSPALKIIDAAVIWGEVLIGLSFISGAFVGPAGWGIILLTGLLWLLSLPKSFPYFITDHILLIAVAALLMVFKISWLWGVDGWLKLLLTG